MKETTAGVILFTIWLLVMFVWGYTKDIKPDLRSNELQSERSFGHPLWNE